MNSHPQKGWQSCHWSCQLSTVHALFLVMCCGFSLVWGECCMLHHPSVDECMPLLHMHTLHAHAHMLASFACRCLTAVLECIRGVQPQARTAAFNALFATGAVSLMCGHLVAHGPDVPRGAEELSETVCRILGWITADPLLRRWAECQASGCTAAGAPNLCIAAYYIVCGG